LIGCRNADAKRPRGTIWHKTLTRSHAAVVCLDRYTEAPVSERGAGARRREQKRDGRTSQRLTRRIKDLDDGIMAPPHANAINGVITLKYANCDRGLRGRRDGHRGDRQEQDPKP